MNEQEDGSQTFSWLLRQKKIVHKPRILVSDFDGTLFTPDIRLVYETLHQNRAIAEKCRKYHIPLIINTSRTNWQNKTKANVFLFSIRPTTIILGVGTLIYHKEQNGEWFLDEDWQNMLGQVSIRLENESVFWQDMRVKEYIAGVVLTWQRSFPITLKRKAGNDFLVRYSVRCNSTTDLPQLAASLQQLFVQGVKVTYLERLHANKLGNSTGDILIIPSIAGKDTALSYLLRKYALSLHAPLEGFCFGDGTIDLHSFLIMASTKDYLLHQFLVHPTPLAKRMYPDYMKKVLLCSQRGPLVIERLLDTF